MADQLLSIEDSTLTAIAEAIRNKGGTSAALSFPDGMVAALQAIETEAAVTPKISPPSTKELTPSDTSFALEHGYHTNSTIVSINATAGSATPSSTEQTYYPPSPYNFFSSFWVDGIGNATQIVTGTVTLDNAKDLTVSGLSFTPTGILVVYLPDPNVKRYAEQGFNAISVPNLNPNSSATGQSSGSYGVATVSFGFSNGSTTVTMTSNKRFIGEYFYIVFGR